jgi:hypothetical protein
MELEFDNSHQQNVTKENLHKTGKVLYSVIVK